MSSIIITIIAIVLVAILAVAGMFYGGNGLLGSRDDAVASQVINQSSQIVASIELYRTNHAGVTPTDPDALIDGGYLKDMPDPSWTLTADGIARSGLTDKQCAAINQRLTGSPEIKTCSDGAPSTAICCTAP